MDLRNQHTFFCQLDLLIKTGTPISQALELLADSPEPESAEAGRKLLRKLEIGVPLSASFGEVFGPVTGGLLGIAERTGSLVQTLQGIATRCADQIRRQDEVRGAIVYPLGVLLLSLIVGTTTSFSTPSVWEWISMKNIISVCSDHVNRVAGENQS